MKSKQYQERLKALGQEQLPLARFQISRWRSERLRNFLLRLFIMLENVKKLKLRRARKDFS